MLCFCCKKEFDNKLNTPRLLIVCGHSFCEMCCFKLFNSFQIQCPQCRATTNIQSVTSLPKNLALINSSSNNQTCTKHNRKFEAFCQKQNQLICIECILHDGHKNHEMDNIQNSYDKNREKWSKKIQKLQKNIQKLTQQLNENTKNYSQYIENYKNIKQNAILFFKQIKQIIQKQQELQINKLNQIYNLNQLKYQQKIAQQNKIIEDNNINLLKMHQYTQITSLNFLILYSEREVLCNSIQNINDDQFKIPLLTFNKKTVSQNLIKSVQSLILVQKVQKKHNVPSANLNLVSNPLRKNAQGSTSIKAVRKNQIVPQNSYNLNQQKKKISSKKDISNTMNQNLNPSTLVNKYPNNTPFKQKQQKIFTNIQNHIKSDLSAVDPKQSLCHSFMSNMTSFLYDKKCIYLIGGLNEQSNNIFKLNLFTLNWEQICQLNTNRSKFGAIYHEKQLYLFGGKKGKERVNDAEIYNIVTKKWSRYSSINKNRSGFAMAKIEDLIYFIGGNDGDNILNTVQTLNLTTGQWKKRQPLNQQRDQLAVVVGKNNKIYAIGGYGGKNKDPLKTVQVYDPKIQKWKYIPSLNQPRRALSAAVLADGIYAIGGFDGNNYLNSVQKFEDGDKEWTKVAAMKQARCTHSSVSLSDSQQIYVMGGFDYVPLDSVERYNIISNQWQTVCKMPGPRFMHASLLIKDE